MKKNIKLFSLLLFLSYLPIQIFADFTIDFPTLPVPPEINNFLLLPNDFPAGVVKSHDLTIRAVDQAGWSMENDVAQGFLSIWILGSLKISAKYGFFESSSEAKYANQYVIFREGSPLVDRVFPNSFSGEQLGDHCYSWDFNQEPQRFTQSFKAPFQFSILSFSKGRFAFMISGVTKGQAFDRGILEVLAKKILKKINIAEALSGIGSLSPLLHSLQVKLNAFLQNYQKGQYKPAVNEMNAFLNELEAQRAKKVSENNYQRLKGFADIIVQSLNALL